MQSLLKRGFNPTSQSVNRLLSSLHRDGKYRLLLHVFSQVATNTTFENSIAGNLIIRALLKTRKFKEAEDRLTRSADPRRSRLNRLWNSLIHGVCVLEGDPERAFALLLKYSSFENALPPSSHTFRSLVFSFRSRGRMDRAIEVAAMMTSPSNGYPLDNYVSSSIISGFCKIGKPELGLEYFENAAKDEDFVPNLMTYTSVLQALLRCNQTKEASDLVGKIESEGWAKDAIFYACLASGITGNFDLKDAVLKHKLMEEKGITPDIVNYSILVNQFCKEGNVEKVVGLLKMMNAKGIRPNLITYTPIVQGFCKRGKLHEATALLRKLQELGSSLDEFAYSTLIHGWCQERDMEMVFKLLDEMKEKGIEIGAVTLNTVINGLCKEGNTKKANEWLKSSDDDVIALSTVLSSYYREMNESGILDTMKRMEARKASLDVAGCNLLIKAYSCLGMLEDAMFLFRRMPDMGLTPNSTSFSYIINVFCKLRRIDEALEITDNYASTATEVDRDSLGGLILRLCQGGMLEAATKVFLRLSSRGFLLDKKIHHTLVKLKYERDQSAGVLKFMSSLDDISEPMLVSLVVNDAMTFLCRNKCWEAAWELYILSTRRNWRITPKSCYFLVKLLLRNMRIDLVPAVTRSCVEDHGLSEPKVTNMLTLFLFKKDPNTALQFLNMMEKREFSSSVSTAIIECLKREGRIEDAYKLVMEAKENRMAIDLVAYSIVIDGLAKEGCIEKALKLCSNMKDEDVKPNILVYNSILKGLCRQGCIAEAMEIFDALRLSNVAPTVVTYDTLVHGLITEGHLENARNLFEEMISGGLVPNLRIYNTMINGYCSFGSVEAARNLLERLERSFMKPDSFTVSSLVNGYCVVGDMEGALECYTEYKKRGITLDFLGFFHLIEGLLSKGRMEEARSVLWDMLQCQTIIDLLNRAEIEIEEGPLLGVLILLCKEGRINDAIVVLSEVGLVWSSSRRFITSCRNAALRRVQKEKYFDAGDKTAYLSRDATISSRLSDSEVGSTDQVSWNIEELLPESKCLDFDEYYPVIASLCHNGELQKASFALKYIMTNFQNHI